MNDMASAPAVRDASAEDMGAVQAIYAHYVLTHLASFEEVPPGVDEMRARRAAVLEAGLPYLVAEIDGRIAGYCYASPYRARIAYRHTVEDSVYAAPGTTGRGVGTALLGELIARCEAGPWRQMIGNVGDSANAGSLALHERMGFVRAGTLRAVGFKFGQWIDTVFMQKELAHPRGGFASSPLAGGGTCGLAKPDPRPPLV